MVIKKLTIEIDNSEDPSRPTGLGYKESVSDGIDDAGQTKLLIASEDKQNDSSSESKCEIGRTFPDLIVEFKNDPRIIAVILFFISFVPFARHIKSFNLLIYPIVLGVLLNVVWFLFPLFKKRKNI
jgi:hypothetical protein